MSPALLGLFVAELIFLVSLVALAVKGFRISALWGVVLLIAPAGGIFFCIRRWREGGWIYPFKAVSYLACVSILVANPPLYHTYGRYIPFSSRLASAVEQTERANAVHPVADRESEDETPAETAPMAATTPAPVDPYAVQRGALAKHGVDLMAEYQQLSAQRGALKPGGGPAVKAFNAKAAHYQSGLLALQAEQRQLDALDHPGSVPANVSAANPNLERSKAVAAVAATSGGIEGEANAALGRLHASVGEGNYAGFAATLRKCLAEYRQTRAFPQITAYARQVMRDAPPARLNAALQQQAKAAQQEYDATTRQVQAIVNQTPPRVVPPQGSTEVYWHQYDPGASKPDFNVADVVTGREDWSGDYTYMKTRPGVFYRSADCEFNPQTKFFITDRNVPKKKLSDAENAEIVRLYRVLGKDETILDTLPRRLAQADQTSAELLALNTQIFKGK